MGRGLGWAIVAGRAVAAVAVVAAACGRAETSGTAVDGGPDVGAERDVAPATAADATTPGGDAVVTASDAVATDVADAAEPDVADAEEPDVADAAEPDEDGAVALDDADAAPPDAACAPACDGVPCGPDGCGGSCGDCASWLVTFGTNGAPNGVAVDAAHRVVAVAFAYDDAPLDLGGGPRDCGCGGWVPYLMAFEATGNHAYSRCFSGWELNLDGMGNAHIATAPDQTVVLAGSMNGQVDWGQGPSPYGGGFDAYIARFSARGGPLWSRVFGDSAYQGVSAVAVAPGGDIVAAIQNNGALTIDGVVHTSLGGSDIVLARLHPDGTTAWARDFGGQGLEQVVTALGVADGGAIALAGAFSDALSFGGDALVAPGPDDHSHDDAFLVRLDAAGDHVWSRQLGSPSAAIHAGALSPDGSRLAVVGLIQDAEPVVIDGLTLAGASAFLLVVDADGHAVWGDSPAPDYILPPALAFDAAGGLWVSDDAGLHTRVRRYDPSGAPGPAVDVGSTFLTGLARDDDAIIAVGTGPVGLDLPANPAGGASFVLRLVDAPAPAR